MYIIFLYLFIIAFLSMTLPKNNRGKKLFIYLSSGLLILLSSLRSISFGTDVPGYIISYNLLYYSSLQEIWNNFIESEGKDPFFYLFSKIISSLGASPQLWLTIISLIFLLAIFKMIYKYSPEPLLSIVAFISLGYFYFSLTGLRQTLALAMIVFSYKYLRERSLIKFISIVLIGFLFHSTAIIFLIAYPIANAKIGLKQTSGILLALIAAYFFKDNILSLLLLLSNEERYIYYIENGSTLSISGFVIQLFIYFFCLYYRKGAIEKNSSNSTLYNLLFLGLVFQSLSVVIAEFFRISMYFSIFSIILIPLALSNEKNKNKKALIYFSILCALISYIIWTRDFIDFKFFWQI